MACDAFWIENAPIFFQRIMDKVLARADFHGVKRLKKLSTHSRKSFQTSPF
jgi:hypothetical protein